MDKSILDQIDYRKARLSDIKAMSPLTRILAGDASDKDVLAMAMARLIATTAALLILTRSYR